MSHTPHELADEFPHAIDALHQLKIENAHFGKLSGRYHELNREIHRIEAEVDAASDFRVEDMKKQRLGLLDEISGMLTAHSG
ncbi:MAG: DUF465 domain-containing protein [Parasphingorhabdus sp.]|uniref:YdcH family protein n=1 Tax=Parasphingorhabdus sp. TaxID=2709688 RepID=UPI003001883F